MNLNARLTFSNFLLCQFTQSTAPAPAPPTIQTPARSSNNTSSHHQPAAAYDATYATIYSNNPAYDSPQPPPPPPPVSSRGAAGRGRGRGGIASGSVVGKRKVVPGIAERKKRDVSVFGPERLGQEGGGGVGLVRLLKCNVDFANQAAIASIIEMMPLEYRGSQPVSVFRSPPPPLPWLPPPPPLENFAAPSRLAAF